MSIDVIATRRHRPTQRAMNLLLEDVRRSPGENLRARRDRINRQREARMLARAETTEQAPAHEDGERFDADFGILNHRGMKMTIATLPTEYEMAHQELAEDDDAAREAMARSGEDRHPAIVRPAANEDEEL